MKHSELQEMIRRIVKERALTKAEKKKKEDIVKGMKKSFKGDKASMYAIATAKAKKIAEGEDHEVSMAISSLEAIAKSVLELKQKLGNQERNIPGWIQDHITNAENYIEQAAQGFHELNENRWQDEEEDDILIIFTLSKRLKNIKDKIETKEKYLKILKDINYGNLSDAEAEIERYERISKNDNVPMSAMAEEKDPLDFVVSEKKGKDQDDDGDVDSEDWKIGRDIAIKAQIAKKK